ncbi:MAG: GDSL-type esterase/lipase family protein [Eubacteriales bacterium]|nr:GDSL-type esterase/lipase family protein [Eubacteriales bacterium]
MSGGKRWLPLRSTVKVMGRTLWNKERTARYLCYSASCVEFYFTGRSLACEMASDFDPVRDVGYECFMGLFVEGRLVRRFTLRGGRHRYALLENGNWVRARVRLMKLTEEQYASAGLCALVTEEEAVISPVPDAQRRIVFIGDSITCGYGVLGADGEPFTTQTQDASQAYAALCAERLGADYELVSYSGIGVISRYVEPDAGEPLTDVLMPRIYPYTDAGLCERNGWEMVRWDFTGFRPQIIVVNLGTNDASYTRGMPEREARFAEAYRAFLRSVAQRSPGAAVVVSYGVMEQSLLSCEREICRELDEEAREAQGALGTRFFFHEEEPMRPEDGAGCVGHPSLRTQRKLAEDLAHFLQKTTGV